MSVVVCCSAGAAPGTTTTALGLALAWPQPVLLADCDREPTQAILAGYLGGVCAHGQGLSALAQTHRERDAQFDVLARALPLDGTGRRSFLPGFTHPGAVPLFQPVWPDLAHAFAAAEVDVIVDAGRIGPGGLPLPLALAADMCCLVTRSTLRSVAAARLYVDTLLDVLSQGHGQAGMIMVGPGNPYGSREVAAQLGLALQGELPWDPTRAAVLTEGLVPPRRFADSGLNRAFARVAGELVAGLDRERARVGVVA